MVSHVTDKELRVIDKLEKAGKTVGSLAPINQGVRTGDNEKHISDSAKYGKWKQCGVRTLAVTNLCQSESYWRLLRTFSDIDATRKRYF